MLTTYEIDRKLNHDIMERKEQKARQVTAHNAMRDETEKDRAVQQLRKLRELTAVTQLERQVAANKRERSMERWSFLISLIPYLFGAAVLAGLLYGLWSHDITFEQVFANGGGR